MAKKKVNKLDSRQCNQPHQAEQQRSQDFNGHPKQNPVERDETQTETTPKHTVVCSEADLDLTDHRIKQIHQIGNRKRKCLVAQKPEATKSQKINTEKLTATETDEGSSDRVINSTSQTALKSTDLEIENRIEPKEVSGTTEQRNINDNDEVQPIEVDAIKINQPEKKNSDERTKPLTNYQLHRQHSNLHARHFQQNYQQQLPTQVQLQHCIQVPAGVTTNRHTGQNFPNHQHFNHLHHQQQGMVTLPAIHASCFLQHAGNHYQQPNMNNAPSTSGEFVYLQQQHYQQVVNNQHLQQHQQQPQIHQQVPFPIITSHPHTQHIINQIPIHFPAIVNNQNLIPLTTHHATPQLPSAILPPTSQNTFTTNCDPHQQQNQTICNPQQYHQQQANTNFLHHWQIQHQKQQQQLHQQTQRHRPQLLFQQQQQKLNPTLTSFFQQPPKQSNLPPQTVTFTQQQIQPTSFNPKQTTQSQPQEISLITTEHTEEKNIPPKQNNNLPLQNNQVIGFESQAVLSNTCNKVTTTNVPMGSTTSTTNTMSTSTVAEPMPAANNAGCNSQGVNLYVKHLDDDVDDNALKKMFSRFGEVVSAKVMMEGQISRGFGFVCFARAEDAARATREIRRKTDDISLKNLYVAPAQRKEERQAFFREKLKSFMEEHLQEKESSFSTPNLKERNQSSFITPNLKERNQQTVQPSLRQSPSCASIETKGDEINVLSSTPGEEKGNAKPEDFKPPISACSGRSNLVVKQDVTRKQIFDLDNFSLERLTIPLIQHIPANTFQDVSCINHESQSEPIPEWFYEADDDDDDDDEGDNDEDDSDSKNKTGDREMVEDKTNQNSMLQSHELSQYWPTFESPTKSCKYSNDPSNLSDISTKDFINRNKETLDKSLCVPSNDDVPCDKGDIPKWIVPSAWNCKLITKEDRHICKVASINSETSCSPDSLYDCKKLVTDCIACCTDTDSADEDDCDFQSLHFPITQNGHNNNSNVFLSLSKKLKDNGYHEESPTIVVKITRCRKCKHTNGSGRRIQCYRLKSISNCKVLTESLERKTNMSRKRKASCSYNHEVQLDHSQLKRRFVMPRLSNSSIIVT